MIEQDPRLTQGPTFFQSLYGLLKRIIAASNTNEKNIALLSLGFAISTGANGYIKFPTWLGGLTIQWGIGVSNTSGDVSISFPITFPTNLRSVVCTTENGGGSSTFFPSIGSTSNSAFNLSIYNVTGARAIAACYWIAIGT